MLKYAIFLRDQTFLYKCRHETGNLAYIGSERVFLSVIIYYNHNSAHTLDGLAQTKAHFCAFGCAFSWVGQCCAKQGSTNE